MNWFNEDTRSEAEQVADAGLHQAQFWPTKQADETPDPGFDAARGGE